MGEEREDEEERRGVERNDDTREGENANLSTIHITHYMSSLRYGALVSRVCVR